MSGPSSLPRLISVAQLAERLGERKLRIYELCQQGMIPHVRIGRSVRFDPDAVREWIDAGGTGGRSDGP